VVFVDISGFTKLSERLASHGKVGAEELSETIGACFVHLLAVAYAHGGGLLKFGGDALLILFSGDEHEVRACQAAVGMRRALREVGQVSALGKRVSLRMSVGIHSGRFNFFLVGDSHRELVVTGPAASTTVAMESTAEAGEILVSEATAGALRPATLGAVKGEGRLLRRSPGELGAWHASLAPVGATMDLRGCVPLAVRESLLAGVHEPEHRRVTVAFIHFDGTDASIETKGADATALLLDSLMGGVQRCADRQAITFLGTDIDRDGGKIILSAGAPSASEHDEVRMLLALREIMDNHQSLPLRVGVHRGFVFAGDIGPHYRRTFTVMGDAVNLTARLMAKALPGQILSTPAVLEQSGVEVETVALEPFLVKGKAQPVRAFVVGRVAEVRTVGGDSSTALVGRVAELETLRAALAGVERGQGALVELVGEPGVGKSRLAEEVRELAGDMVQLKMSCEPYEASTPYYAFRRLLRDVFGIEPGTDDDGAARRVRDTIGRHVPDLAPWAPLFGMALDVSIPDTAETGQLEEQFRRPRLAQAMADLFGAMFATPTLLTIEDTHWMDEASADILTHLSDVVGGRPWLVCVTRRVHDGGFAAGPGQAVVLALAPLDQNDAAELIHRATEATPLPPHEIAALAERSGGNPLFLRELVAAAQDARGIDSLPDTIEAVIASRIDQLSPVDRNLLRRASVLGRSFPRALLRAVIDDLPHEGDATWRRLGDFVEGDGGTVSFVHALVRDSAYDGLRYRLRQELHARAGDTIRELAGEDVDEQAALLSLHYFHAHRYQEAWEFSMTAAERAIDVYANVEAAEFYERALDAGRHIPGLDTHALAAVREALGDACNNAGDYAAAEAAYRTARRFVDHDPVAQARLVLKLAKVMGWLDRYSAALRWITKGLRSIEGVPGTQAAAQRAQLLAWYGRFCQEEGHHARAMTWCNAAVTEAERAQEHDALANALKVLDWASMDLGRLQHPDNWYRALHLFEELGDLTGQASVFNFLGGLAYFRGRWDEALDLYRRAQAMVRRTGNAVMDAFYMNNIGEIALEQGRLGQAAELFTEASRIWRAAGYRSGAASIKCNLGRVACGERRYEDALRLFEESLAESEGVGGQVEALDTSARMAECLLLSGEADAARRLAEQALERSRVLGGVAAQTPLLHRVRGVALLRRGDAASAGVALEQSLEAGRARGADYEVALTLEALAELDEHTGVAAHASARHESRAILERLGVVWTPALLAPGTS